MTQEEKSLLLKDLSARLPYGVCVHVRYKEGEPCYGKLTPRDIQWFIDSNIEVINPYLRPMSSMTEEEENELSKKFNFYIQFPIWQGDCKILNLRPYGIGQHLATNVDNFVLSMLVDWLNAHHLDYRGLIPMGLALEASKDMYKFK